MQPKDTKKNHSLRYFLFRHSKIIPVLLSYCVIILMCWLALSQNPKIEYFIKRIDYFFYDWRLNFFQHETEAKNPAIVIVDIDDSSIEYVGRWPWPRSKFAELLKILNSQGAIVVAFDVVFSEPQKNVAEPIIQQLKQMGAVTIDQQNNLQGVVAAYDEDQKFAQQLKASDNVLGYIFNNRDINDVGQLGQPINIDSTVSYDSLDFIRMQKYIASIPLLQNAAKYSGFLTTIPDEDGIIRSTPLLLQYKDKLYPSMALQAVILFNLVDKIKLDVKQLGDIPVLEGIWLGKYRIPTNANAQILIPYYGKAKTIPTISVADVFKKNFPENYFENKLVFIGSTALGIGDHVASPMQSVFPGVEIQASVAAGIIDQKIYEVPEWARALNLAMIIIIGLILAHLLPFVRLLAASIILLITLISVVFVNFYLWNAMLLALPIAAQIILIFLLAIMNFAYGFLFEYRQKHQIKGIFEQYVSPTHIKEMLRVPEGEYGFEGETREMTVLFSDIRHFTQIAEHMDVAQLKNMLNDFFSDVTDVIFKYGGTIDKYVGDLVMAFWGAPLTDIQQADHALQAAFAMQEVTKNFDERYAGVYPEIHIGVGINSGTMNVGDMGSKYRRNYTVLGDAVNLGSRIEALTKFYKVEIIVSEYTQKQSQLFAFRYLDKIRVPGKLETVAIYEPLILKTQIAEKLKKEIDEYETALNDFYAMHWDDAEKKFQQLIQLNPKCFVYQIYLERCAVLKTQNFMKPWDGVFEFKDKM